jgi:hypothetical protein
MEQRYIAGDWVKNRGKLARIEETYRTNYFVKDYHDDYNPDIEYDDAYFFREVRPQDLVPIPLTYEMLEKNGWKWDGQDFVGACLLYPEGNYFVFDAFRTKIKYVHQLQHLLFGLGIYFDFNLENNYENN